MAARLPLLRKTPFVLDPRPAPRPRARGDPSAICHLPPAICHLPSATCHLPSATCHLPSAICHLPSAICHLPPAICHLPPAIFPFVSNPRPALARGATHLPSATCHLPSATCHLPPAIFPFVSIRAPPSRAGPGVWTLWWHDISSLPGARGNSPTGSIWEAPRACSRRQRRLSYQPRATPWVYRPTAILSAESAIHCTGGSRRAVTPRWDSNSSGPMNPMGQAVGLQEDKTAPEPRALLWAGMGQAFGLRATDMIGSPQ
jgi:hypothetical protein